jgi:predicted alpha/beta-hydrolase family hydrolase
MAAAAGTLVVDAKLSVPWQLDAPAAAAAAGGALALLLTHGASGDLAAGRLPEYAAAAASAGFPCLRFTCKSNLAGRARAMKVGPARAMKVGARPPRRNGW